MNEKNRTEKTQHPFLKRTLFISLTVLIAGCLVFPFYYPTTTTWYKFGTEKIMLQIGQICGLLAFVFLCVQIVLALHHQTLEQILGRGKRARFHQKNGLIIEVLLFAHVLLILIPEGLANLPFGIKFWPEMIGSMTFFLILFTVFVSYFRKQLHLKHTLWRSLHKPIGYLVVPASAAHIYFVSDAFEKAVPQIILFALVTSLLLWVVFIKAISKQNKAKELSL